MGLRLQRENPCYFWEKWFGLRENPPAFGRWDGGLTAPRRRDSVSDVI
jgi:hypothetical protein